jgi:hypothetical protein
VMDDCGSLPPQVLFADFSLMWTAPRGATPAAPGGVDK